MDKLAFLVPGIPMSARAPRSLETGFSRIVELGLDGMELEYVHGVSADAERMKRMGALAQEKGLTLTAHAPYYINFTAREQPKVDRSYQYVLDTARVLHAAGGYSVVFHTAYYMGSRPELVFAAVREHMKLMNQMAEDEGLAVDLRPELMGKGSQFGTLDEILQLVSEVGGRIKPCIDFAHLHARTGLYNTYEEFVKVFETIASRLGADALKEMHMHYSGIRYNNKGEQNHLIFRSSDARYREFAQALIDCGVSGALVCESPNSEGDTLLLKRVYQGCQRG